MIDQIALSLSLLALGITPNLGFFSFAGIGALILALASLLFQRSSLQKNPHELTSSGVSMFLVFIMSLNLIFMGGLYQHPLTIIASQVIMFIFLLILIARLYGPAVMSKIDHNLIGIVLVAYFMVSILTLFGSPSPQCDCFWGLKEAPLKLVQGGNPYNTVFTSIYPGIKADYFLHLPNSFLIVTPAVLLFGDPRLTAIVLNILAALAIYSLFSKKNRLMSALFAATYLFLPRSFFMLEHMYQDPLIIDMFVFFLYFYARRKDNIAFFFLGMFFSIKQHLLLLLPLLFSQGLFSLKKLKDVRNLYFLLPFTSVLVFLLINPPAFIKNTVLYFFNTRAGIPPVEKSLSVITFMKFLVPRDSIILVSLAGIFIFLILYLHIFKSKKYVVESAASIMLAFHLLLSYSFFNHYYLVMSLLFLAGMLSYFRERGERLESF